MIIITGATGTLGRAIVEQLVTRVPSGRVGVSVRNPGKATHIAALGVRVREGDFAAPDGLEHAFEGAEQLMLVSSNAASYGGDPLAQHAAAISAARAAGVKRIVYTSHMAASAASAFPPMRDHAATETMLRDSGLAWTALRNGFYAASGITMMGDALATGVLEAPVDGPVSWTTHGDLAEVAAILLADSGRFEGATPPLIASEAVDLAGLAAIASALSGRSIRRDTIRDEELTDRMTARGVPTSVIAIALGYYTASRNGEFARVDPTLEQLLGRRPTTMRAVIAETVRSL